MSAATAVAMQLPIGPQSTFGERTINDFIRMYGDRQINLEPGFQRQSVWSLGDRRRLIQSIVSKYPLPSIFLYQRHEGGRVIYDVIDGKQRLETILMFTETGRFKRDWFQARLDIGKGEEWHDWRTMRRQAASAYAHFLTYKIPIVEITGPLGQIIDLFVRINSTGKPLTSGEKRHARYFHSRFLKEAERLVSRFRKYLLRQKILSQVQLSRMKGTELFSELLMSIHSRGFINKKTALDRAIGNDQVNQNSLKRISREFVRTLNTTRRIFREIRQTRFHNTADFYSLFMLVWEMRDLGFVLSKKRRNQIADKLLRRLSTGVDELRQNLRQAKPARPSQRLYADYLLTVQGDTDSASNRQRRAELLRGIFCSLFERKDDKRTFSSEQRRIIWNRDESPQCADCGVKLTWENFTMDHIMPWVKGGKTSLDNAALRCRSCNSSKRDRTRSNPRNRKKGRSRQ